MKKTIIASAVTALLATSAIPAIAANSSLDLDAGAGVSLDSDLLTAQTDVGVDAGADASEDGVNVDAGVDAGADVDVDAGESLDANADANANTNAGANANAGGMSDQTFGSVMASIDGAASVDLTAVTEDTDITIIALSSLQGNADTESAALDTALSANADAQASLLSNVEGNAAIMAELEAEGYVAEDVVSLKSSADGSIIVYVDDRA